MWKSFKRKHLRDHYERKCTTLPILQIGNFNIYMYWLQTVIVEYNELISSFVQLLKRYSFSCFEKLGQISQIILSGLHLQYASHDFHEPQLKSCVGVDNSRFVLSFINYCLID